MKRFFVLGLALMGATALADSAKIIGYFPSWGIYGRGYFPWQVPAEKLTHINYAFVNVKDGECVLADAWADKDIRFLQNGDKDSYEGETAPAYFGNFRQLNMLKEKNPDLKLLLSLGGWTLSKGFSDAALTPDSRAKLVTSCVNMMQTYGFDGIDVDWEYPAIPGDTGHVYRPEDTPNSTALFAEFRKQLDVAADTNNAEHYLLTAALPAGSYGASQFQLKKLAKILDWANLMTYDFSGPWESKTGFNAALFAPSNAPSAGTDSLSAVKYYLKNGFKASQLVLGVPFYGHSWAQAANTQNGLYQTATNAGAPAGAEGAGTVTYREILKDGYLSNPEWKQLWHNTAKVPWLYNPTTQGFISYDNPKSMEYKTRFIKALGLGGAMFWEITQDDDNISLLNSLYDGLNN